MFQATSISVDSVRWAGVMSTGRSSSAQRVFALYCLRRSDERFIQHHHIDDGDRFRRQSRD